MPRNAAIQRGSLTIRPAPQVQTTLQRPCTPVHPHRLALSFGRHRLDRMAHLRPVAHAQRRTRHPAQFHIIQIAQLAHLAEVVHGRTVQIERRLLADFAPDPVAVMCLQARRPAALHGLRRRHRVAGRHAQQGQHGQLAPVAAASIRLAGQIAGRAGKQSRNAHGSSTVDDADRCARSAHAVGFGCQARLAPDIGVADHTLLAQAAGCQRTSIVAVALAIPALAELTRHLAARASTQNCISVQRIAAHLPVIAHAEGGVIARKTLKIAVLAQLQQPVIAQAILLVGAGIALQKGIHLRRTGRLQAGIQLPVGRPGLQRMTGGLGQQHGQRIRVLLAPGLRHVDQRVIVTPVGLRLRGHGAKRQQACHNGLQTESDVRRVLHKGDYGHKKWQKKSA